MDQKVYFSIFLLIVVGILLGIALIGVVRWSKKREERRNVLFKCASCGEISSVKITQNFLGHIGFGANFNESGFINPNRLDNYGTPIEDWIIGKQDKYRCCKKCGYYEKIGNDTN